MFVDSLGGFWFWLRIIVFLWLLIQIPSIDAEVFHTAAKVATVAGLH